MLGLVTLPTRVVSALSLLFSLFASFHLHRLEKRVYIPLPDEEGRIALFKINMLTVSKDPDVDWNELAAKSKGYSGADVANVCRCVAVFVLFFGSFLNAAK